MSRTVRIAPPADPSPHVGDAGRFVKLVGGWACLDFVNTVRAWLPPGDRPGSWRVEGDRLTSYADLLAWAEAAGAVEPGVARALSVAAESDPDGARGVLERARAVRASIHALLTARVDGSPLPEAALADLDAVARSLARGERLVEKDGVVSTWWATDRAEPEAVLWPVVRSALGLLGDRGASARVGRCDGDRCGWLFVDVSRGRRRRWCDMADCGNVAKVRAHRARERRHARRSGGSRP